MITLDTGNSGVPRQEEYLVHFTSIRTLTLNLFIVSKDIDYVHYSGVSWRAVSILKIFLLKYNMNK